jgi:hypothetical protein
VAQVLAGHREQGQAGHQESRVAWGNGTHEHSSFLAFTIADSQQDGQKRRVFAVRDDAVEFPAPRYGRVTFPWHGWTAGTISG